MVRLVPMTESDFEVFTEKSVREYAAENVRAGNWSEQEALECSRQAHYNLLSQGVHTENNYLFTVQDEETNEKVGILWLKHEVRRCQGFIYNIEMDADKRGKGYGKQAMLALEPIAKGLGIESIALHVFAHNPVAVRLYTSLGYEVTSQNMLKKLGN